MTRKFTHFAHGLLAQRGAVQVWHALLLLLALFLALPVLALLGSWLQWNAQSVSLLQQMLSTVLPRYSINTLLLCLGVGAGVMVMGAVTACAVTLFDFPGRRFFEWALLLPLAMPAYVLAYAYTDFLQFSGPLQTALRSALGVQGRVLPDIRSLWGAVLVLSVALYPYVYLLARTALAERAAHLMEAARLLGAPLRRRIKTVALPMARPAIAAGVVLALMETVADYGVVSYFGVQTFTAGIYKAWLSFDDRVSAAQLATLLLLFVLVLLKIELHAQKKMRYALTHARAGAQDAQPQRLRGARVLQAWLVCGLPILLGFVLPLLFMLRPLAQQWANYPWAQYLRWSLNSLSLAFGAALLASLIALALGFAWRRSQGRLTRAVVQLAGMGYAVPGAVVVVGLLLPVGWLQQTAPSLNVGYLMTATVAGLMWAYLVRFSAVALQSVQAGYARIPASFDDSAKTLGVSAARLLGTVHWPLLKRSVLAAALLVFVDVMKELPATLVLRPFNSDTLAVITYQLAKDERLGEASLPALTLVLVGLIPVMLLSRALRAPAGAVASVKRDA
jgi:iron(III) transport system permease protein